MKKIIFSVLFICLGFLSYSQQAHFSNFYPPTNSNLTISSDSTTITYSGSYLTVTAQLVGHTLNFEYTVDVLHQDSNDWAELQMGLWDDFSGGYDVIDEWQVWNQTGEGYISKPYPTGSTYYVSKQVDMGNVPREMMLNWTITFYNYSNSSYVIDGVGNPTLTYMP